MRNSGLPRVILQLDQHRERKADGDLQGDADHHPDDRVAHRDPEHRIADGLRVIRGGDLAMRAAQAGDEIGDDRIELEQGEQRERGHDVEPCLARSRPDPIPTARHHARRRRDGLGDRQGHGAAPTAPPWPVLAQQAAPHASPPRASSAPRAIACRLATSASKITGLPTACGSRRLQFLDVALVEAAEMRIERLRRLQPAEGGKIVELVERDLLGDAADQLLQHGLRRRLHLRRGIGAAGDAPAEIDAAERRTCLAARRDRGEEELAVARHRPERRIVGERGLLQPPRAERDHADAAGGEEIGAGRVLQRRQRAVLHHLVGEQALPGPGGRDHAGRGPHRRAVLRGEQVFQVGLRGDLHVHPAVEQLGAAALEERDQPGAAERLGIGDQLVEIRRRIGDLRLRERRAVVPDVQHLGFLRQHVEALIALRIAEPRLGQQRRGEILLPVLAPQRLARRDRDR